MNVERLLGRPECFGNRPCRFDRAAQAWRQNRAAVDGHDSMRARGGKADFKHAFRAASRMKHSTAAAVAVRVDKFGHRRVEPGLTQRRDDEIALPGAIAR